MPPSVEIRPLQISISGNNITLKDEAGDQTTTSVAFHLTPLQRQTIDLLVGMLRENRLRDPREYEVLGANLWAVLFDNDIGRQLHAALSSKQMLRVQLEFAEGQEGLAVWPWEYLYCPLKQEDHQSGYFLANRPRRLLLTRQLRLTARARPLRVEHPPVRVLFVVASPDGDESEPLGEVQYERLLEELQELKQTQNGRLELMELISPHRTSKNYVSNEAPKATYRTFIAAIEDFEPHVIHFVGHGRCTAEGGQIAFVGEDYKANWVADTTLSQSLMDFEETRLVFLQACESALPDPYQAISGVARQLAHRNIPAVVAMQYRVENAVAGLFARAFYGAVAKAHPIDVAVQQGRKEIAAHVGMWTQSRAFGLPVLYLRQSDTQLFPSEAPRVQNAASPPAGPAFVPQASRPVRPEPAPSPMTSVSGDASALDRDTHGTISGTQTDTQLCPSCQTPYVPSPEKNFCSNLACMRRLLCPYDDCRARLQPGEEHVCGKCGRKVQDARTGRPSVV